jgi:TNF receptor-associated factor 1
MNATTINQALLETLKKTLSIKCLHEGCNWQGTYEQYSSEHIYDHLKLVYAQNSTSIASSAGDHQASHSQKDLDQEMQNYETAAAITDLGVLEMMLTNTRADLQRMSKACSLVQLEKSMIQRLAREVDENKLELHRKLIQGQLTVGALEERLDNIEACCHQNGSFLFAIRNVSSRRMQTGGFNSKPFYTNPEGYKMCLRVYLNGDGAGRQSHLSLFVVLLCGEYDALLKWPFGQHISFILLDQIDSAKNFTDSVQPDRNSSSFRRPLGPNSMNAPAGLPLFMPLGQLTSEQNGYIKEDTLFIKVSVGLQKAS